MHPCSYLCRKVSYWYVDLCRLVVTFGPESRSTLVYFRSILLVTTVDASTFHALLPQRQWCYMLQQFQRTCHFLKKDYQALAWTTSPAHARKTKSLSNSPISSLPGNRKRTELWQGLKGHLGQPCRRWKPYDELFIDSFQQDVIAQQKS